MKKIKVPKKCRPQKDYGYEVDDSAFTRFRKRHPDLPMWVSIFSLASIILKDILLAIIEQSPANMP